MFKSLTNSLVKIFDKIRSKGVLTEADLDEALREIRIALLEADVAIEVIKDFINSVKERAIGQEIIKSISPGQLIVKIVHDQLVETLNATPEATALKLDKRPTNILMVGLQGSGKTSSSAKLALRLKNQNKKVLLVSLDIHRPAAQEQLEILAKSVAIDSLPIIKDQLPLAIVARAMTIAEEYDVIIYDTAGRLHVDDKLMTELQEIKDTIKPSEVILVVDSLIGQDAVNIAKKFDDLINITAIILTRIDADGRGGAALSIKYITNKPIKFLSVGEKIEALEEFEAERLASRILDMGDVVSFVAQAQKFAEDDEAQRLEKKILKGSLSLNDYLSQIRMMKKLGSSGIMSMIPGVAKFSSDLDTNMHKAESLFKKQEAIILSMTKKERRQPTILNASRKKRIAAGSGTLISDINKLFKDFEKINNMVKRLAKMKKTDSFMGNIKQFFT